MAHWDPKINLGQIITFLLGAASAAGIAWLALERLSDRVADLEEKGSVVDYALLADELARNHAESLRGPAGKNGESATSEEIAQTILERYRDDIVGPEGPPGRDAPEFSLEELAEELASNYADELRGPKGDRGLPTEPTEAVPLDELAKMIVENHRDELLLEMAMDSLEPERRCELRQWLEVCIDSWSVRGKTATVGVSARNTGETDLDLCTYSRYAFAVSETGEKVELSSNRKCWQILKEARDSLSYVFDFREDVGNEFDFVLELETPYSQFFFLGIPSKR